MIQNGTKKLTAFETVLGALLDNGHTVTFKEVDGQISVRISGDKISVSASSLEQVGELLINAGIAEAFKADPEQGGAGNTRIDGGELNENTI